MELQLKDLNKENIEEHSSNIFHPLDSNLSAQNKQPFLKTQQSLTNRKPILRPSDSLLYSETYQGHAYESTLNRQLDPRDELVRIPINFAIPFLQESKKKWSQTKRGESQQTEGKDLIQFKSRVADWIISVVDIVTSVAFNHLRRDNFTDGEAKAFSAKNILGNIKQLFLACKNFGEDNRVKLCEFIDSQLCGAFGAIITRYPQTSSKGASQRVRKCIKHINNRASDEFDFLNIHRLNLKFKQDGDYSSQILQVFNKIITIAGQSSDIYSESTFFEQYKQFCQRLTELVPEGQVKYSEYLPKKGMISNVVNRIPCSPQRIINEKVQSEKDIFFSHLARKIINGSSIEDFTWQPEKISKGKLKIAQKIPSWVPTFSEDDIHLGRFKARHPSVLRVLNKWTEQLLDQIQNSQQQIGSKINKFKTSQGELIFLTAQEREALAIAVKVKLSQLKKQLAELKEQNKLMQSRFACEYSAGKFINRDTDVGVFSAKLSELVSQYVFQFANKAIHLLMKCVRDAQNSWKDLHNSTLSQHTKSQPDQDAKVDLVTFKLGDLFRGKYQCCQSEFISLLQLLYTLDKQYSSDFKLVRIKNRLDQKDNDLLINYLFKGKILCQLQLSILAEQSKKECQYSSFNHFLYEIKRAQFGPLSELACISAQYDPVIASFAARPTFAPELKFANLSKSTSESHNGKIALKGPFICGICEQLKQVFNPQFFQRSQDQANICNQCLQQMLLNDPARRAKFLSTGLKAGSQIQYLSTRVVPYFPTGQTVQQISRNFITRGLYVPLNRKKPKVHFFRSVISLNDNRLILSTLDPSGEIKNFEKIDFSAKDLQQLQKYVFFDFPQQDCQIWEKICFSLKNNNNINSSTFTGLQILNKQNLQLVIKTLKSSEQVLYLSGREGIIQLSENYLQCQDRRISKERKDLFLSLIHHIKYVELEKCGITEINTYSLSKFKSVIEMNLSYNKIQTLSNYSLLKELKVGQFFTNLLESNKALESFPYLRKLNLSHNILKSISGLENLKQISILDLSGNQLSSVGQLQQLTNLQWLSLKNNKIEDFPKLCLPYLTTFDISQNFIKVIRSNKMPKLKILNLRENQIQRIQNIHNSPDLQDLSLNCNKIKKIQGLQQKILLKSLNLSENSIQLLQNLQYLQQLQTLWLNKNQLQNIEHLNNLPKLTRIDLSHNKIRDINTLIRRHEIKYINLKGNPITQKQLKQDEQLSNFKLVKIIPNQQLFQL